MAERTLTGAALDEAIDEATTTGGQLLAARLMSALAEELKGVDLDTARAVTELVHTKNALRSLAEEHGITDMPAKLWGPDMVKRIERELLDG